MSQINFCLRCGNEYVKKNTRYKYCSKECGYKKTEKQLESSRKPRSEETKEKMRKPKGDTSKMGKHDKFGEKNPNFGKKLKDNPESYEKFRKAVKERGQVWSDLQKNDHSEKMKGNSNWMRGKKHKDETIEHIKKIKKDQYINGDVKFRSSRKSSPEYKILELLKEYYIDIIHQFHIKGFRYYYDFFIPSINTIIEYNGDYWHANPHKYQSGSYLNIQRKGSVLVNDIWKKDEIKINSAKLMGYNVFLLWESDFKTFGIDNLLKELHKNG